MKNLTTKLLVALTCVAFASVQYANADATIDGVLSGADITSHSGGLTKIDGAMTKDASLHFNADTKVNWGHLNVAKDESLHFLNGNNNILNVVQNGASRFAGQVTGQTGKIIISNPNGIIFTGGNAAGTFAGNLILTTKDMAKYTAEDIAGLNADQIKAIENGKNFGVVALKEGASITAGKDITIIANGVSLDSGSKLLSNNGDVLITADGANFVAANLVDQGKVTLKVSDSDTEKAYIGGTNVDWGKKEFVYTPISVYKTEITAKGANGNDGTITIDIHNPASSGIDRKTNMADSMQIDCGSTLNANNIVLKSGNNISNRGTTFNGNLIANADQSVKLSNTTVNGNANVEATKIAVDTNSKINGDLTLKDTRDDYGPKLNRAYIQVQDTDVAGKLTISQQNNDISQLNSEGISVMDPVDVFRVNAGSADITGESVYLNKVNFGNTDVHSYGNTTLSNNSVIDGNLNIATSNVTKDIGSVLFGSTTKDGQVTGDTVTVTGDLNVDAGSTIAIAGKVDVGGKANLSTARSSVIVAETSDDVDTGLDAKGGVIINAPKSVNRIVPKSADLTKTYEYTNPDNGEKENISDFLYNTRTDNVTSDVPNNPDNPDNPDNPNPDVPGDEPEKNITNLIINGVDTTSAQAFTPIAFAADDEPDNVKRIAKIVFKTPDGVVSISDRLIQKDINSSF